MNQGQHSMIKEAIQTRIRRFADALKLALFDKRLEIEHNQIVCFYDADVVLRMIGGFEVDLAPSVYRTSEEQRLMRALLSSGYLGKAFMLRPHALELDYRLQSQIRYVTQRDKDLFMARARQYLQSNGIENIMSRLQAIVSSSKESETKIVEFLSVLRSNPGPTFSAIEMVNGTWTQRLKRYSEESILSFDMLGPEMKIILDQHENTIRDIGRTLKSKRPRYTLNDFRDAIALTILQNMISEREKEKSRYVVRFYTETRYLREACFHEKDLYDLLCYKTPLMQGATPGGAEFIVRDASYFLMRAWFSELAPVDSGGSIESLQYLSDQLNMLLRLNSDNLEKAISALEFEGKNLQELVVEFEKLAIMDAIWTRDRIPAIIAENLAEWTEIFAFAQGELVEARLFEEIEDIQGALREKISQIRTWTRDFETILKASAAARTRLPGVIEDPMRDIGLVRWGYDLSEEQREDLVRSISLLFEDDSEVSIEAGNLATRMDMARSDPKHCLQMSAVLWTLGLFGEIASLVKTCDSSTSEELPPPLLIIQAASEIKGGASLTRDERRKMVDRIWKLKANLPEESRGVLLLGVGYILYHAWHQESVRSRFHNSEGVSGSSGSEVQEWARMSFKAGEEASYLLSTLSLSWAFSINHCAYVGIVTGVEPTKTEEYLVELLKLQSFPAFWNSRFEDTLGMYYLVEAERRWLDTEPKKRRDLDLSDALEIAARHFNRAAAYDFGDIDLAEHISRLRHLEAAYNLNKDGQGKA